MMKNVKKNVIFSGVGYILPLIAALVTIPLMVKYLGTDLYGLYAICISLVGFMTLVDLGVGQTVVKYVAEYEATNRQDEVKPVLDIALLIYLVIGLCTAGLLYMFSAELGRAFYDSADDNKRVLAQSVLHLTAIALLFSYVNQFFLNVCKAYHRFDMPALIQNVGNLGGIVVSSIILILGYSIKEVMMGYVAIYFTALLIGYFSCLSVLPPNVKLGASFNKVVFKRIISFSFYTFVGNFVTALTSRADKLLIGGIIGTEAVTYYQIPYTIAQMANGIVHTLVQITFPRFSELSGLEENEKLLALYKKVTLLILVISTMIAVLLISAGGEFLKLWLSPDFAQKTTLTLQIAAAYFFLQANIVTSYWVIQSKGNAQLIAWIAIVGAIAYFFSVYYLGAHYSYNGATLALFALLAPVPIWFFWLEHHVGHSFLEYLAWIMLAAFIGLVVSYLMLKLNAMINNGLLAILTDGMIVVGIPVLVVWLFFRKNALSSIHLYG